VERKESEGVGRLYNEGEDSMTDNLAYSWDPGLLIDSDEFDEFSSEKLKGNILFIAGIGIDPRTCIGCEKIIENSRGSVEAILLEYDEGETSPSLEHSGISDKHEQRFLDLLDEENTEKRMIQRYKGTGHSKRRIESRDAMNKFSESDFTSYDKVIFDISAMPKSILFPILGKAISIFKDNPETSPEMYTIVTEDPSLDKKIDDKGPEESAAYIPGYGASLQEEATKAEPCIWIPVLGEQASQILRRAYETIEPDEVLPVFPSPSVNPRRSDDLINEYHDLLFDEWIVDPNNYIYASESNPFDLYRQILDNALQYKEALQPVGECKFAVTATSSKLLSIGAMISVLDLKWNGFSTGLAQVPVEGYGLPDNMEKEDDPDIYCVGLAGSPYKNI
jgi:hypothetical protein